ncbi:g8334 [Coccomyxa viridis]|uniref:G8334 protein n=1 Tax=Coccomyxa viridis TaxID=1274662 RepID=A0ABP1G050_9CHLO
MPRAVSSSRQLQKALETETERPQPGTVSPYEHHIFLRFPPKQYPDAGLGSWWPKIVERTPEFLQAFGAVAAHRKQIEGVVRISAFENADLSSHSQIRPGKCDAMLFPSGMWVKGLDQEALPGVIAAVVSQPTDDNPDFTPPPLKKSVQSAARSTPPLSLFVCTHGSRDCRCGTIGDKLVRRLDSLIAERDLEASIAVFRCSHIGGHKYAGNVLVYGGVSPCDGDWYGGVTAEAAEGFLDALTHADISGHGGVSEATLRPLWRGRMGLSKDEQLQAFESGTLPEDDLEDGDDWEYVEEDGDNKLNGETQSSGQAQSKAIPLAEVSQQVFQEHAGQSGLEDVDTSASDKSQAGTSTFSDLELTSSSDSESSESGADHRKH